MKTHMISNQKLVTLVVLLVTLMEQAENIQLISMSQKQDLWMALQKLMLLSDTTIIATSVLTLLIL